jgi:threonine dehydratase
VQSDAAPAAFRSWRDHAILQDEMKTFAEGLATRVAFELPQHMMWQLLDDFVLVSDDEIRAAQRVMIEATRNLIEAAGAAPLAAAVRLPVDEIAGTRVALIASGGNASPDQLRELLA